MGVRGLTSRISRRFVLILALAQLLLIYAWIVEPNWIEVTSHEAWFKNLPEEFNGLVVAHLSDLHMRKYGARERRGVGIGRAACRGRVEGSVGAVSLKKKKNDI